MRQVLTLRKIGLGILPILIGIIAWQLATLGGGSALFPSFTDTVNRLWELLLNGELLEATGITLYRSVIGLLVSVLVGTTVGMMMGRISFFRWFFNPLIAIGFPLPTITLIPVFMLWFGTGNTSKIWLVALTCFFPLVASTYEGARSVGQTTIWAAESLGTGRIALLGKVILPSSVPFIFSGIRVALPLAVIVTFVAEMVAGGGGLGFMLIYAFRFLDTETVLATLIAVLILGLLLDQLLLKLRAFALPWDADEEK